MRKPPIDLEEKSNFNEKFSRWFRSLRKSGQPELTQCECAKIFNVDTTSISKWETGDACPDFRTIVGIAKHFNASIDDAFIRHIHEIDATKVEDWMGDIEDSRYALCLVLGYYNRKTKEIDWRAIESVVGIVERLLEITRAEMEQAIDEAFHNTDSGEAVEEIDG